jgi:hypothetical protein
MILHIAALAAVAAVVVSRVRAFFKYDEPMDNSPSLPQPPEYDPAKLAEALDAMADESGLKWRTSIVDFLKLLHRPARFVERDALWRACGEHETYRGTAEQNIKLHKLVFDTLRASGLPLPSE